MWERIVELVSHNPNLAGAIFGLVGMFFTAVVSYLLKRPIVRQAIAADDFKATLAGYEALNRGLQARVAYFESQQRVRDAYEDDLRRQIRELDPTSIERRWRHLCANFITELTHLRRRLERHSEYVDFNRSALFEQFVEDGGRIPDHWYEALGIDQPSPPDLYADCG